MTTVDRINIVIVVCDTLLTEFTSLAVQYWLERPFMVSLNSHFSHGSTDSPEALHIPAGLLFSSLTLH